MGPAHGGAGPAGRPFLEPPHPGPFTSTVRARRDLAVGGHPRSSQATPRSSSYSMCPSGHMSVPSFAWLALLTGHHHLGAPSSAPCNPAFPPCRPVVTAATGCALASLGPTLCPRLGHGGTSCCPMTNAPDSAVTPCSRLLVSMRPPTPLPSVLPHSGTASFLLLLLPPRSLSPSLSLFRSVPRLTVNTSL